MTYDISRAAHDPAKKYTSVRLQQGRVVLDDDWNESESITGHIRSGALVDVIGSSGTSDAAFLVSNVATPGGDVDFDLGEGIFYIGGHRVEVADGQRYLLQDDDLAPDQVPAPGAARQDLVWIEAWEQPVTAVEDAELREVGLGGPDTAARTRIVAQVRVETDVGTADCEDAFESTVGADVDERGRLTTDATLTVTPAGVPPPDDLCQPPVAGGYLTHANQAIRVQLTAPDHFTWGFDNASPLYRVELAADRQTVTFRTPPADEYRRPRAGQVVELIAWGSVLPNLEKPAQLSGQLATVGTPYDPDLDQLTLAAPLPAFGEDDWTARDDSADLEADGRYLYLRVWDRGDDPSPPEIPFVAGTAATLGTTGLEVTIDGTALRAEHHWIAAARPAEPTRVVPWELLDGRAPHGPVRYRAPLAVIDWDAAGVPTVRDCRRRFRPLTEIRECCEVTVGDGSISFGDYESIQAAVDSLPPTGGRVCVRPGRYEERVLLDGLTDVQIVGCGAKSIIAPAAGTDPVISIDGCLRTRIADLAIAAADGPGIVAGAAAACEDLELDGLLLSASPFAPGISVAAPLPIRQPTRDVRVTRCHIEVRSLDAPPSEGTAVELSPAVFLQAQWVVVEDNEVRAGPSKLTGGLGGIQIGGTSRLVWLRRNLVLGGNGNGITLGSLLWVPEDVVEDIVANAVLVWQQSTVSGWWAWFIENCLQVGGDPPPPGDPAEPPLVPVSAGPLRQVWIEDNLIGEMGADGIAVARFFEPDRRRGDLITVEDLSITGNDILGNRRTAADRTVAEARLAGQGGIALAECIRLEIARNRIEGNGADGHQPTCGIYVLAAEGMSVEGNTIVGNGRASGEGAPALGQRGGIVVRYATELAVVDEADRFGGRDLPALRVIDNVVDQPIGRALGVAAVGRVVVHGNQFAAGNLSFLEILQAAFTAVMQGELSAAVALVINHLLGAAVLILDLGLPIDLIGALGRRDDTTVNYGTHNTNNMVMFYRDSRNESVYDEAYEATATEEPVDRIDTGTEALAARTFGDALMTSLARGGAVQFNDNQVTLDLLDDSLGLVLCSVFILSLDDVSVNDNQLRCLTGLDFVLADLVAAALATVRVEDNRLQELGLVRIKRGVVGTTLISGLTWATMNTTMGNQSTGMLLVRGPAGSPWILNEHNQRW